MSEFVFQAETSHGGDGVAAGDDANDLWKAVGECLRYGATALLVGRQFEETHRAVPEYHFCLANLGCEHRRGSWTNVKTDPIGRYSGAGGPGIFLFQVSGD